MSPIQLCASPLFLVAMTTLLFALKPVVDGRPDPSGSCGGQAACQVAFTSVMFQRCWVLSMTLHCSHVRVFQLSQSAKPAGNARFSDNRADEQERGVTVKHTGVSLVFEHDSEDGNGSKPHVTNLTDFSGPVDFSSEVIAALRIADGDVVVVECIMFAQFRRGLFSVKHLQSV